MSAPQQQLNRLATEKDKLTKELERTRGIIKVSDACEVCFILFPLSISLSLSHYFVQRSGVSLSHMYPLIYAQQTDIDCVHPPDTGSFQP